MPRLLHHISARYHSPKDCGQNTANMSTVTVVATLFSLIKEDLNETYSHQGLPLMNT